LAGELSKRGFEASAFFCNSGAEANEAAIKFARRYSERFGSGGYKILSFENSFHGRTLGALSATGQEKYRRGFEPLPGGFEYVPYNDIKALEEKIGSDPGVCALLMEPVQGEGGVIPARPEFMRAVREICNQNDVLLIFDEVQTGVGRSGKFFCYQNYEIEPDLVTLAKGLGGGYPIGALLVRRELRAGLQPGEHASTFGGNPFVCAMALTVLEAIDREEILQNVVERGRQLEEGLQKLAAEYGPLKNPRGVGLMIGLPLEDSLPASELMEACRRQGLIVGTAGKNSLRFVPPLIISEDEIVELLERLKKALQEQLF
ncbi:MAG: aspartate aminotransferase family protein, partial [bacterium]